MVGLGGGDALRLIHNEFPDEDHSSVEVTACSACLGGFHDDQDETLRLMSRSDQDSSVEGTGFSVLESFERTRCFRMLPRFRQAFHVPRINPVGSTFSATVTVRNQKRAGARPFLLRLKGTSPIGRSLQKSPLLMKRWVSSGAKFGGQGTTSSGAFFAWRGHSGRKRSKYLVKRLDENVEEI